MTYETAIIPAFAVHQYGRTELAQLYAPNVAPETAWRRLNNDIHRFPGLIDRLRQLGYDGRQRYFTPRQVKLIVQCIGEP